jgi:hypothetical protein
MHFDRISDGIVSHRLAMSSCEDGPAAARRRLGRSLRARRKQLEKSLELACFGMQVALRKKGAISRDSSRDYAISDT